MKVTVCIEDDDCKNYGIIFVIFRGTNGICNRQSKILVKQHNNVMLKTKVNFTRSSILLVSLTSFKESLVAINFYTYIVSKSLFPADYNT